MGGRSLDKTSSQAMYRALDTAPFRARGKLLQEGGEGERDVQISSSEDEDSRVIMWDASSSFNTRSSEQSRSQHSRQGCVLCGGPCPKRAESCLHDDEVGRAGMLLQQLVEADLPVGLHKNTEGNMRMMLGAINRSRCSFLERVQRPLTLARYSSSSLSVILQGSLFFSLSAASGSRSSSFRR